MSLVVKKNPVGIDWHIRKLQEKLYDKMTTKWGGDVRYDCYGRCDRTKTDDGYKAAIYKTKKEYGDVYFDDATHDVISFFGVSTQNEITEESVANVHLVVFAKIDFKSSTKRSDEEIRRDVYDFLQKDPYGFRLEEQVTGIESCLSEYPGSQRDERLKFFDMHPHHVFRFNLVKRYDMGAEYPATEEEDVDESDLPASLPSGGSGITQITSLQGTEEPGEGLFFTIDLSSVGSSSYTIFLDKEAWIDWGDGSPVMRYQGNALVTKQYSGQTTCQVKVYWGSGEVNQMSEMWFYRITGAGVIDSFGGDFNPQAQSFRVGYGLAAIPENLPTARLKNIEVDGNAFTEEALNDLLAFAVSTGLSNGSVAMQNQTTSAGPSNEADITTLQNRNWNLFY